MDVISVFPDEGRICPRKSASSAPVMSHSGSQPVAVRIGPYHYIGSAVHRYPFGYIENFRLLRIRFPDSREIAVIISLLLYQHHIIEPRPFQGL